MQKQVMTILQKTLGQIRWKRIQMSFTHKYLLGKEKTDL